jgi:phosphate-selective porin OprO/OprP
MSLAGAPVRGSAEAIEGRSSPVRYLGIQEARPRASILVVLALLVLRAATVSSAEGADQAAVARAEASSILIRNVHLIGREGAEGDVLVNVLIVDGRLDVVTRDDIAPETVEIAVDAERGFLMGKLQIGEPPSFVILDQNPRENFDVVLDTAAHVLFAMRQGVVVKSDLPDVAAAVADVEPEQKRWMAYTPPPVAVPLDYYSTRRWNKFESKAISGVFNGALALDRLRWLSQDDGSEAQVADLREFDGGEIRALRFGVVGTLNFKRPWVYTVYAATNAFGKGFDTTTTDDFTWFDYRLDIPLPAKLSLSIGKQKEPISLERLTSLTFLPWQERSAPADALLPSRSHGIVLNGRALEGRSTWAVGAFNNWIDADTSLGDTTSQLVGRMTWVPFASEDESNLLHLGLGLRHSDAKQEIRARTEAELNQSPLFVDTGPLRADDALSYLVEAYWRRGPYLLGFEYIGSDVDSVENGDPRFYGYHVSISWALTGEMRPYRWRSGLFDPLPVARPVNQGGWGAWEAAARYSTLDLSDGLVEGGEMDTWSLGLNWWLTRYGQFSLNYRYIGLDRFEVEGTSSGLNARLTLILY